MSDFSVTFNGFDLTSIEHVEFARRLPHELPQRELKYGRLARSNGQKLLSAFYANKSIEFEGYIDAPDRAAMELARDTLLMRLQKPEANLDIVQAGSTRTYKATLENIAFTHISVGKMTFSISMKCGDPFGQDAASTFLEFDDAQTDTPHDYPITIGGTFPAELVLAVAVTDMTTGTNKTVTIANPSTGEAISVTRNWVDGDNLVIHVRNKDVTVNGVVADYSGVFPLWQPGEGVLRYSDNFDARNVTLSGSYYKRYL